MHTHTYNPLKSIIYTICAVMAVGFITWSIAQAATIVTVPTTVTVKSGESIAIAIGITPKNETVYSGKIELHYPSDLLELQSFTLNSQFIELNQNGYSATDNMNGVAVRTAGFPGGITEPALFATVTFKGKTDGGGKIMVGENSVILNASNANVLTDVQSASSMFTVYTVKTVKNTSRAQISSQNPTKNDIGLPSAGPTSAATGTIATSTQSNATSTDFGDILAGVATGTDGFFGTGWGGIVIAIIVLLVIIGIITAIARRP